MLNGVAAGNENPTFKELFEEAESMLDYDMEQFRLEVTEEITSIIQTLKKCRRVVEKMSADELRIIKEKLKWLKQ